MPRLRPIVPLLALATLLAACETDSPPQLHDLIVTGVLDERLGYFYGEPRPFAMAGRELELAQPEPGTPQAPLTVPGALRVDGAPALREPVDPPEGAPVTVRRIPLTTDLQLRTEVETRAILYYDGDAWFVLGLDDPAGLDVRVTPRPRTQRLRGLGMTVAEADALATYLEGLGERLVVTVATEADTPRRAVDGLAEYRATALHVQRGIDVDQAAFRQAPRTVQWEVLARGSQAVGVDRPSYRLIRDQAELLNVWNLAHGAALEVPPVPTVNFANETVLAIFRGTRPTGGYAIDVRDVTLDGGDLLVDVRLVDPGADAVVTQALTSPWVILRVLRGGVSAAWFRDPVDERLYAVARRTD